MNRQHQAQMVAKEGRISLALVSLKSKPCQSIRAIAAAYDVPESTLRLRLRRIRPKHEQVSVNRKLLPIKEQSLVR
ncbi:hypothetical protein BCR34DRAFT_484180 [Clohesyomyces aquaticus]|uniref:HTH psq-type domain-containing protein n=1 Tax=Clohesyomyces aquaticus TaxID=1231657 RepID=A0A1Y1ZMI0_9PLEO|nr:hypothetical protein BCR34DRAFT_484180 [Clohesyomyces aquaticus]